MGEYVEVIGVVLTNLGAICGLWVYFTKNIRETTQWRTDMSSWRENHEKMHTMMEEHMKGLQDTMDRHAEQSHQDHKEMMDILRDHGERIARLEGGHR